MAFYNYGGSILASCARGEQPMNAEINRSLPWPSEFDRISVCAATLGLISTQLLWLSSHYLSVNFSIEVLRL